MSPEARERSFDELARGLASGGVSRREALKWLGAALLGGAALAFTPKVAEAKPHCWCYQRANGSFCSCPSPGESPQVAHKECERVRASDPSATTKCRPEH